MCYLTSMISLLQDNCRYGLCRRHLGTRLLSLVGGGGSGDKAAIEINSIGGKKVRK